MTTNNITVRPRAAMRVTRKRIDVSIPTTSSACLKAAGVLALIGLFLYAVE